jgi:serine/threonine protein phosphatase PrpC
MGVYLSEPEKTKETDTGETSQAKFVATGMQGWRKEMEDSHISHSAEEVGHGVSLYGVFDGHGGKEVALYIKKAFLPIFKKTKGYAAKDWGMALEETFFGLDEVMREDKAGLAATIKADIDDFESCAGATATVIALTPTEIVCANAGDSRTVLSRGKSAFPMSEDHKPNNPEEQARIEAAGGFVSPDNRVNGNLALSRAIGDFEYKKEESKGPKEQPVTAHPDIKKVPLTADCEFVVLACDGIWDVKTNEEVVAFLHANCYDNDKSLDRMKNGMEALLEECCAVDTTSNGGLGCDNMTAILVHLHKN